MELNNFIGGQWVGNGTLQTMPVINPANGEQLGTIPLSTKAEVDAAVGQAKAAQKEWALVPAPKRADYLYEIAFKLKEKKEHLAQTLTLEMGKVIEEARGEVQEGIDMALYMAAEGRRLFGETVPSELTNKFAMSVRAPIGVAGLITPWNFPIAIATWKAFPALVAGNTPNSSYINEDNSELIKCDERGFIVAGEDCATNVPGVYAGGDIRTKKLRQVVTAVADGANAINSILEYLNDAK